jgi:hypothetical protein
VVPGAPRSHGVGKCAIALRLRPPADGRRFGTARAGESLRMQTGYDRFAGMQPGRRGSRALGYAMPEPTIRADLGCLLDGGWSNDRQRYWLASNTVTLCAAFCRPLCFPGKFLYA